MSASAAASIDSTATAPPRPVCVRVPSPWKAKGWAQSATPPSVSEPQQVAAFFRDDKFCVHYEPDPLVRARRYRPSKVGSDLNEGFNEFVAKKPKLDSAHLRHIVQATQNAGRLDPFNSAWCIDVTRYAGIIFFDIVKMEENQSSYHSAEQMERFSYYGYKFEELSTRSSIDVGHNRKMSPVDANVEYCGVFRTRLNKHRLLLGAEMDAEEPGRPGAYVELKTSRVISTPKQQRNFNRYKTLKYWIQSYMVGTPKVVVAFRDDGGIIRSIKEMATRDLAAAAEKQNLWSHRVCLTFADSVLTALQANVKEGQFYRLSFEEPFDSLKLEPRAPTDDRLDIASMLSRQQQQQQ